MNGQADYAWAAGLFEGEGTVFAWRSKTKNSRSVRIEVCGSDLDVVERFHAIVGVGSVRRRAWNLQVHHKTLYTWSATGVEAWAAFQMLRPWLGERRRARAEEVFAEMSLSFWQRRDEQRAQTQMEIA